MRNLEILILVLSALFCTNHCEEQSNKDWELFKIKYGKNYSQESKRKHIWEQNKKIVKAHSRLEDKNFQVKLNKFSDLTNDEFKKLMNGFKPNRTQFIRSFYDDDENNFMIRRFDDFDLRSLPNFVDWRTKGFVTSGLSKNFYIYFYLRI